ncbi:MAG: 50S ribosomal protein L10 [Gemmatimonadetes bacterium]|nr:50S ribosomal protein L10 [Gemmatimonadota bacterium]
MSKTDRQATVESLATQLKGSPNVFVTDFQGLNVARMTELRRRLRAAGGKYVVVKNTLAQRALAVNGLPALPAAFKGQVGLVLAGADPLPAAKVVGEFAKEFQKPSVKAGLLEGKTVEPAYVKRLGEIPSREALLGMFAGALNSILYQVVGALEALRAERDQQAAS